MKRLRVLLIVGILWGIASGAVLLQILPRFPHTHREWLVVLVLGPPVYVIGEALDEPRLEGFYGRCGFRLTAAGVIALAKTANEP